MSRKRTGSSLCAVALAVGLGGSAGAETLAEALADAYRANATILAGRAQQRQTDETLPQAQAAWRPSVNLQGNIDRAHQYFGLALPGTKPVSDLTPTMATLMLDQPIYHGGAIEAGIDRARAEIAAGQSQLSETEQTQLLAAATAYLDVYRDHRVVNLNGALVDVLTLNRHDVQVTYAAGAATETDTAQATARLEGAVAGRLGAEAQLGTSLARFRTAVGREAGTLEAPGPLGHVPADQAEAEAVAIGHSPRVAAARRALEAARQAVAVAEADLRPSLDAVAVLQHADDDLIRGVKQNQAEIGLQATVPIYRGATFARIRGAKEGVTAAETQVLEAERAVREAVVTAWNALQAARAEQGRFRTQITANQVALDDTIKEQTAGTRTRLDVLNAQQELFTSRVSLVGAEHDTLLATFQLEAALGLFTPSELALATPDYDPSRHLDAVDGAWWGTTPRE